MSTKRGSHARLPPKNAKHKAPVTRPMRRITTRACKQRRSKIHTPSSPDSRPQSISLPTQISVTTSNTRSFMTSNRNTSIKSKSTYKTKILQLLKPQHGLNQHIFPNMATISLQLRNFSDKRPTIPRSRRLPTSLLLNLQYLHSDSHDESTLPLSIQKFLTIARYLRMIGFSEENIINLAQTRPTFFSSDLERDVIPKVTLLHHMGISYDIVMKILCTPYITQNIHPNAVKIQYLLSIGLTPHQVGIILSTTSGSTSTTRDIAARVRWLHKLGFTHESILHSLLNSSRVFTSRISRLEHGLRSLSHYGFSWNDAIKVLERVPQTLELSNLRLDVLARIFSSLLGVSQDQLHVSFFGRWPHLLYLSPQNAYMMISFVHSLGYSRDDILSLLRHQGTFLSGDINLTGHRIRLISSQLCIPVGLPIDKSQYKLVSNQISSHIVPLHSKLVTSLNINVMRRGVVTAAPLPVPRPSLDGILDASYFYVSWISSALSAGVQRYNEPLVYPGEKPLLLPSASLRGKKSKSSDDDDNSKTKEYKTTDVLYIPSEIGVSPDDTRLRPSIYISPHKNMQSLHLLERICSDLITTTYKNTDIYINNKRKQIQSVNFEQLIVSELYTNTYVEDLANLSLGFISLDDDSNTSTTNTLQHSLINIVPATINRSTTPYEYLYKHGQIYYGLPGHELQPLPLSLSHVGYKHYFTHKNTISGSYKRVVSSHGIPQHVTLYSRSDTLIRPIASKLLSSFIMSYIPHSSLYDDNTTTTTTTTTDVQQHDNKHKPIIFDHTSLYEQFKPQYTYNTPEYYIILNQNQKTALMKQYKKQYHDKNKITLDDILSFNNVLSNNDHNNTIKNKNKKNQDFDTNNDIIIDDSRIEEESDILPASYINTQKRLLIQEYLDDEKYNNAYLNDSNSQSMINNPFTLTTDDPNNQLDPIRQLQSTIYQLGGIVNPQSGRIIISTDLSYYNNVINSNNIVKLDHIAPYSTKKKNTLSQTKLKAKTATVAKKQYDNTNTTHNNDDSNTDISIHDPQSITNIDLWLEPPLSASTTYYTSQSPPVSLPNKDLDILLQYSQTRTDIYHEYTQLASELVKHQDEISGLYKQYNTNSTTTTTTTDDNNTIDRSNIPRDILNRIEYLEDSIIRIKNQLALLRDKYTVMTDNTTTNNLYVVSELFDRSVNGLLNHNHHHHHRNQEEQQHQEEHTQKQQLQDESSSTPTTDNDNNTNITYYDQPLNEIIEPRNVFILDDNYDIFNSNDIHRLNNILTLPLVDLKQYCIDIHSKNKLINKSNITANHDDAIRRRNLETNLYNGRIKRYNRLFEPNMTPTHEFLLSVHSPVADINSFQGQFVTEVNNILSQYYSVITRLRNIALQQIQLYDKTGQTGFIKSIKARKKRKDHINDHDTPSNDNDTTTNTNTTTTPSHNHDDNINKDLNPYDMITYLERINETLFLIQERINLPHTSPIYMFEHKNYGQFLRTLLGPQRTLYYSRITDTYSSYLPSYTKSKSWIFLYDIQRSVIPKLSFCHAFYASWTSITSRLSGVHPFNNNNLYLLRTGDEALARQELSDISLISSSSTYNYLNLIPGSPHSIALSQLLRFGTAPTASTRARFLPRFSALTAKALGYNRDEYSYYWDYMDRQVQPHKRLQSFNHNEWLDATPRRTKPYSGLSIKNNTNGNNKPYTIHNMPHPRTPIPLSLDEWKLQFDIASYAKNPYMITPPILVKALGLTQDTLILEIDPTTGESKIFVHWSDSSIKLARKSFYRTQGGSNKFKNTMAHQGIDPLFTTEEILWPSTLSEYQYCEQETINKRINFYKQHNIIEYLNEHDTQPSRYTPNVNNNSNNASNNNNNNSATRSDTSKHNIIDNQHNNTKDIQYTYDEYGRPTMLTSLVSDKHHHSFASDNIGISLSQTYNDIYNFDNDSIEKLSHLQKQRHLKEQKEKQDEILYKPKRSGRPTTRISPSKTQPLSPVSVTSSSSSSSGDGLGDSLSSSKQNNNNNLLNQISNDISINIIHELTFPELVMQTYATTLMNNHLVTSSSSSNTSSDNDKQQQSYNISIHLQTRNAIQQQRTEHLNIDNNTHIDIPATLPPSQSSMNNNIPQYTHNESCILSSNPTTSSSIRASGDLDWTKLVKRNQHIAMKRLYEQGLPWEHLHPDSHYKQFNVDNNNNDNDITTITNNNNNNTSTYKPVRQLTIDDIEKLQDDATIDDVFDAVNYAGIEYNSTSDMSSSHHHHHNDKDTIPLAHTVKGEAISISLDGGNTTKIYREICWCCAMDFGVGWFNYPPHNTPEYAAIRRAPHYYSAPSFDLDHTAINYPTTHPYNQAANMVCGPDWQTPDKKVIPSNSNSYDNNNNNTKGLGSLSTITSSSSHQQHHSSLSATSQSSSSTTGSGSGASGGMSSSDGYSNLDTAILLPQHSRAVWFDQALPIDCINSPDSTFWDHTMISDPYAMISLQRDLRSISHTVNRNTMNILDQRGLIIKGDLHNMVDDHDDDNNNDSDYE